MNWVQRKIYLYNVTFGLYMLEWWERCLFNILMLVLLWFICYNGSRSASELYKRAPKVCVMGYGLHPEDIMFIRSGFSKKKRVNRLLLSPRQLLYYAGEACSNHLAPAGQILCWLVQHCPSFCCNHHGRISRDFFLLRTCYHSTICKVKEQPHKQF